ncbi:MAG: TraR/DksA family transcriptional regulator [Betaproteobacteria bacterium]
MDDDHKDGQPAATPVGRTTSRNRNDAAAGNDAPVFTAVQIGQLKTILSERELSLRARMRRAIQMPGELQPGYRETLAAPVSARLLPHPPGAADEETLTGIINELIGIEAARESLKNNTYGFCISCHGPISFSRLLALPGAQRCLPCQESRESADWIPTGRMC